MIAFPEGSRGLYESSGEELELWQENLSLLLPFRDSRDVERARADATFYK